MFIGRKDELKQLENIYANEHSNVLVIYGRAGIGKTTLALKFCEKKHYIYYKAGDVSEDEQIKGIEKAVIEKMHEPSDAKTVLVIDEFRFAATPELKSGLMKLIREEQTYGRYMVLLLSSSVNWIENSMVAENKDFARFITGIFKIKELSFAETVEWFPKSTASDCVMIRAILGGVPRYLKLWQENRRIRENLLSLFFSPDAPLLNEAEYLLKLELRELGAYNTILTALATGRNKLNDIFEYTGYGRAKISVYLKNLSEMDIVEKVYSVSVRNAENTKKGVYRIKDNFLNFYYAYVFPNMSDIETDNGKYIYNKLFVPDMGRFMRKSFSDVCREYLEIMSKYKKLGRNYTEWQSWYGKKGILDIVGTDSEKNMLVGMCFYSDKSADFDQLDEFKLLVEEAGIRPKKLCLFSKSGFEPDLARYAKEENIMTVSLADL